MELHFQPFRRQLDGCERVLDLVRQSPRHLTPGLGALCGNNFGNVVKHQQTGGIGQLCTAGNDAGGMLRHRAFGGTRAMQIKRLLPMVESVLVAVAQEGFELLLHRLRKGLQARHIGQGCPGMRPRVHAGCVWHQGWTNGWCPGHQAR
jgi:hypothetical protein